MPNWSKYLQIIVFMSIGGFGLVIFSGFWHVIALLMIAVAVVWLWKPNRSNTGK